MTMVSKTALGIAAGIFGTLFVGYCVYFDRQRRSDPNFKKKLKETSLCLITGRKANKMKSQQKNQTKFPDLANHEAIQAFFLHQVQLGEELLGQGDVDGGIEHLCNAVTICGQPNQILEILQQTLPPNLFLTLLQRLPNSSQRVMEGGENTLVEDDVE
ncbi:mitochondrial import receptor subunit TOM20 homolog isoform X1 [Cimex lectularius]|uniref:Mitochondrial import receptor subunit TOM20 homolog n=1 Tax=Cimex lectularius TaxID=79782 RepID=A0A8I6SBA1_CIMLE|nr:mitochondrial import receptor subunit TOM20 homolog isoform X1 [Cimex lectularius]